MSSGSTACPAETVTGQPLMNHVLDARVVRGIDSVPSKGLLPPSGPEITAKIEFPILLLGEKGEGLCSLGP